MSVPGVFDDWQSCTIGSGRDGEGVGGSGWPHEPIAARHEPNPIKDVPHLEFGRKFFHLSNGNRGTEYIDHQTVVDRLAATSSRSA